MSVSQDLETRSINTIRGLALDAVEKAKSGHAGLPLGAAVFAYTLWSRHLRFDPKDPHWFNRDRFILSAGHGCMLQYALLHLTGYDLPMSELERFRQVHSKTPGHPENTVTPGIEMATGPLGQGVAHSVGFAIAERHLAALFNKPDHTVVGHFTYVICSDGDMMEGCSNEAASLAGHLQLGKLIWLYDDNGITIDGKTNIAFTEDVGKRFEGLGWHIQHIDGEDLAAVDQAIVAAKNVTDKPSLILCRTTIGYGSPKLAGTNKAHSNPFGSDELKATKENLGIPLDPFHVDEDVYENFRSFGNRGGEIHAKWNEALSAYEMACPDDGKALRSAIAGDLGTAWIDALPAISEKQATRKSSEAVIAAIAPHLKTLIGGSADLAESTLTTQKGYGEFQPGTPEGRTIDFGIREHGMAAAVNGITLHGGARAFGASFLTFTDYCRPSLRLAALMECPSIFIFTHDSIGLGEDGPTHQSVEHVTALRAIPNFNVIRPADGNETVAAWKVALESRHTPTLLALTRQGVPALTPSDVKNHPAEKGAYVLEEATGGAPKLILIGTGSEVQLCVEARKVLETEGTPTRVVSMPSWFLYERQSKAYQDSVLPKGVKRLSVEAGVTLAWPRFSDAQVGIDRFGLSGPGDQVMKEFGFTPENVVQKAKELLSS
ncbi:MAG TPA: transketolase [Fimbriimonas sp.]|nr:transketolase [Fimbriimonas sp.]